MRRTFQDEAKKKEVNLNSMQSNKFWFISFNRVILTQLHFVGLNTTT
jgi:hypothetical protein